MTEEESAARVEIDVGADPTRFTERSELSRDFGDELLAVALHLRGDHETLTVPKWW